MKFENGINLFIVPTNKIESFKETFENDYPDIKLSLLTDKLTENYRTMLFSGKLKEPSVHYVPYDDSRLNLRMFISTVAVVVHDEVVGFDYVLVKHPNGPVDGCAEELNRINNMVKHVKKCKHTDYISYGDKAITKHVKLANSRVTLISCADSRLNEFILKSVHKDLMQITLSSYANKNAETINEPIIITDPPRIVNANPDTVVELYSIFKTLAMTSERPVILLSDDMWSNGSIFKNVVENVDSAYIFNGIESVDEYNIGFTTSYKILKERE